MKDDGSKDMVECKQGSEKDQKKKCKKDYFRNVCVYSCCQAGFPPVDSKCANLEQPKEVLKEGSTKTLKCEQDDAEEQASKCGKGWFAAVCIKSCCDNVA